MLRRSHVIHAGIDRRAYRTQRLLCSDFWFQDCLCAAFVFIRADEYPLTDVLRKVSASNAGMLAAHEKVDTDVEFFLLEACLFQFLGDFQRFDAVFPQNFVEPCVQLCAEHC